MFTAANVDKSIGTMLPIKKTIGSKVLRIRNSRSFLIFRGNSYQSDE